MLRLILFCVLSLGFYQSASADIVHVTDGDCMAFNNAIVAANAASSSTTIVLARGGNYSSDIYPSTCHLNADSGHVIIDGSGSTLTTNYVCGLGAPISVGAAASLTLRNINLVNISNSCLGVFPYGTIQNSGDLNLENVVFQGPQGGVEDQSGANTVLRNVTWVGGTGHINGSIFNSTLNGVSLTGQIKLANSLLSSDNNFGAYGAKQPTRCIGSFVSLGGNVTDSSSCFLSLPTDHLVTTTSLGMLGNNGGLVSTQALPYDSPARKVGVAQYCEALDARGVARSAMTCDAGAYEYGGGNGQLAANGLDGLYFDPAADGHYVSLQRIHDNGDIFIVWNTFDQKGNQAWVMGTGQLGSDKHIRATMYQNTGGVLQAGGPAIGSTMHVWGSADIDLQSCLLAQFNYQSSLPNFGSGQFPLTRLALVSNLDCSE